MKARFLSLTLIGALLAALIITPAASAQTATSNPTKNIPVTGAVKNKTGKVIGTFTGSLDITGFHADQGKLYADGTLTGVGKNRGGQAFRHMSRQVSIPVTDINGNSLTSTGASRTSLAQPAQESCSILNLTLGPLHLDLLGLVVDLNQIHLTINAVPGAGNLLGNLLCAVAGLLDNGGPLSGLLGQISDLLNEILGILNGL